MALLGLGGLVLLFWCYLQWGTGFAEHGAQLRLGSELAHRHPQAHPPGPHRSVTSTPAPYRWPVLADGAALARLVIPAIGVDQVVVQGTDTADLREGPGHYSTTPYPGQAGNVAIAGHRTTYAHPFFNLDELHPGDMIDVSVPGSTWRYQVVGSLVVSPDDVAVAGSVGEPGGWLTLTTCNPRYSAATRLVVRAKLLSTPTMTSAPSTSGTGGRAVASRSVVPRSSEGPSWQRSLWPIVGWSLTLLAAAALCLVFARRCRRVLSRRIVWLVGGAGALVVLFELFGALAALLPAGY